MVPKIPNYQVVRKLGRRVAIKVLQTEYAARQDIVARFLNEARAANLIRHRGIVDIYEFGQASDGSAYIIMELIEGSSLSSHLRR
jgi:serine/threonine-protein kinase